MVTHSRVMVKLQEEQETQLECPCPRSDGVTLGTLVSGKDFNSIGSEVQPEEMEASSSCDLLAGLRSTLIFTG